MPGNARIAKLTGLIVLMVLTACGYARAQDGPLPCNCFVSPPAAHTLPQDDPFWDEIGRYFQRIETNSLVSGDARAANTVTHIIDPWPPYARNRRIPRKWPAHGRCDQPLPESEKTGCEGAKFCPSHYSKPDRRTIEDNGSAGMGGGGY